MTRLPFCCQSHTQVPGLLVVGGYTTLHYYFWLYITHQEFERNMYWAFFNSSVVITSVYQRFHIFWFESRQGMTNAWKNSYLFYFTHIYLFKYLSVYIFINIYIYIYIYIYIERERERDTHKYWIHFIFCYNSSLCSPFCQIFGQ